MRSDGTVTIDDLEAIVPSLIATAVSEQQARPASAGGLAISTLTVHEVGNGTIEGLFDEDDPAAPMSTVQGSASVGDRVKVMHTASGGAFVVGTIGQSGGSTGGGPPFLAGSVVNEITAPTALQANGTATTAAEWILQSAGGTTDLPTALTVGDQLGSYAFGGYGTDFTTLAGLRAVAAETFTATAGGTDVSLFTTPIGSVAPRAVQTWRADGSSEFFGTTKYPFLGSAVSTEWEHMAGITIPPGALNRWRTRPTPPRTRLDGAITNSADEFDVENWRWFPTSGVIRVKIDDEIIRVNGGLGTTTWGGAGHPAVRGGQGTIAAAHADGAPVIGQAIQHIVVVADSLGNGAGATADVESIHYSYPDQLRAAFSQPDYGGGFRLLSRALEYTKTGTWTRVTAGSAFDLIPHTEIFTANGSGNIIEWVPRHDEYIEEVHLYWADGVGAGDGSYSIDGGAWVTIPSVFPVTMLRETVVACPGVQSVRVRAANAAGTGGSFTFGGLAAYAKGGIDGFDARGQVVHSISKSGSKLTEWVHTNVSGDNFRLFEGDHTSLRPALAILEFTNDFGDGFAGVTAFTAALTTAVQFFHSIDCDVVYINIGEQDRSVALGADNAAVQAAYRDAVKSIAVTENFAVLDMYDAQIATLGDGSFATADAAGWWEHGASGSVHPTQVGYDYIASRLLRLLSFDGGPKLVVPQSGTNSALFGATIKSATAAATLEFQQNKGTPSSLGLATGLIRFKGAGDNDGTLVSGAAIGAVPAEDYTTTAGGTNLVFQTAGIGSTTLTTRAILDSAGTFSLGLSTNPKFEVDVSGSFPIETISRDAGAALSADDTLGQVRFSGAADASHTRYVGAGIYAAADENFTTTGTHGGSRLAFQTTAIGASAPITRGGIDSTGTFFLGLNTARWVEAVVSGTAPNLKLYQDQAAVTAINATIGQITFVGSADGTHTTRYAGAAIGCSADEAFATAGTHSGSRLVFQTSAIGAGGTLTTRFGADSAGQFFVGTNAARNFTVEATGATAIASTLAVTGASTLTDVTITPTTVSSTAYATHVGIAGIPGILTQRINGTVGSPTKVVSGNTIGAWLFQGQYDTTVGHFQSGAAIQAVATQDFSSADFGTKLLFKVADNTSSALATAMTVDQDKSVELANGLRIVPQAITLANGANNNIDTTSSIIVVSGPTAAFNITGFTRNGATPRDGDILIVINTITGFAMTVTNDATSTAANRILTNTGADLGQTAAGGSTVILVYNATASRWQVVAAAA